MGHPDIGLVGVITPSDNRHLTSPEGARLGGRMTYRWCGSRDTAYDTRPARCNHHGE